MFYVMPYVYYSSSAITRVSKVVSIILLNVFLRTNKNESKLSI